MVTALGMACARWRRGEKTGARPRAVGWRSSLTNVPCNLLSSMIESENAAALQHNETVSSCSSSSSSRELCVCAFLEFAGVAGSDVPPAISDKWHQSRLRAGDRSRRGIIIGIITA